MPPTEPTVTLRDPATGDAYDVPESQVRAYTDRGFTIEGVEQRGARLAGDVREKLYGGVGGAVAAGLAGAARGVTLGLSDAALRALGGEDAALELQGLREVNPGISLVTEIAGGVAPAFVTGGAATPAGLAARAGSRVAATGAEAGTLTKLGAAAAGGALEGGLQGLGQGVSELALSTDPLSAERIASSLTSNALFGAGVGGAVGSLVRGTELGLRRAKGAIDTALERRAAKARTPEEAVDSGDLSGLDKRVLDKIEKAELERLDVARAPQRKALTDELDAWRKANRDAHELREITKGHGDPNVREASGAFNRANVRLRQALDDRIGFAEDPLASRKIVRTQSQALEEMMGAARQQERLWREAVDAAPAQIRSALDDVSALGQRPRTGDIPEYSALRSQLDDAGQDYLEQTVPARSIAGTGYYEPPGAGADKVRVGKARRAMQEGQQEAIKLNVTPSGRIVVDDGRHRLAAAIRGDLPIRVRWSTGYEPSSDMVLRAASSDGASLLAARKGLASQLGLGDEMGPFTEAGKELAAERVLKSRMGLEWGGSFKQGLKEPSLVRRIPTLEEMLAANQRLQAKLDDLAKTPASDRLAKIAEARAVLETPAQPAAPSLGAAGAAALGVVAPFAGPLAAAVSSGNRVLGGFRNLAAAATTRVGKAASAFLGKVAPATKYVTPVATKTLIAARYEEGQRREREQAKSSRKLPELYRERTDEIKRQVHIAIDGSYQMRPAARQKMAAKFDGIRMADPMLADQLETAGARRIEYLASIMPRLPDFGTVRIGPERRQVSELEMRRWARAAAALDDPEAVFERAAHGKVSPIEAAALRAVFPGRLQEFTDQVIAELPNLQRGLPRRKKIALSILTGVPVDPTMTPAILDVVQSMYEAEPGSMGGTQSPMPQAQFGSVKRSDPGTASQQREGLTA